MLLTRGGKRKNRLLLPSSLLTFGRENETEQGKGIALCFTHGKASQKRGGGNHNITHGHYAPRAKPVECAERKVWHYVHWRACSSCGSSIVSVHAPKYRAKLEKKNEIRKALSG